MITPFEANREFLLSQLDDIHWIDETGPDYDTLDAQLSEIAASGKSRMIIRAKCIAHILEHAKLSLDGRSCFTGCVAHQDWLPRLRAKWQSEIDSTVMRECLEKHRSAMQAHAYISGSDFGHIAPDWASLLKIGFPGMLARVRDSRAAANKADTDFYDACEIVCTAILTYVLRIEALARNMKLDEIADRYGALAFRAPETIPEAFQLMDVLYMLLTHVEGESLRSFGRIDRLLISLFRNDLASGRYTREELAEYTRHFFARLHAWRYCANVPFVLGGLEPDGSDSTNELSMFLVEVYATMHIHDPKMQIRVADSTPPDFLRLVLRTMREGMNSFVFINDNAAIPAMQRMGVPLSEARDYLLVGCYETAICGKEIPCSCNGYINLPKVVESALNNGIEPSSGMRIGPATGSADSLTSFDELMTAVKAQYRAFADGAIELTNGYEALYPELNPAPIFSATLPRCVQRGVDAYSGGAEYNNSSINSIGLATAVDVLAAIRKYVFEEKAVSLAEMVEILNSNWEGQELLRRKCLLHAPKYGNADPAADSLTRELTDLISETINGRANNRGGHYRSGLFSIDFNLSYGEKTGASADGRFNGDPISKNLCAGIGRDKAGVTALIRSVSVIDHINVPNGSVLDVSLHPTVTKGAEGLSVLEDLLRTHCKLGCFGLHINILDASQLKAAQKNPEKYASLQVRVCGWNAYFVNLSETEQNQFILRAEALRA